MRRHTKPFKERLAEFNAKAKAEGKTGALWQNREALDKYLSRLAEYWDEEKQEWMDEPKSKPIL